MQANYMDVSTNSVSNLRDHMANERTFLAWIRTSLGIMAFGFVVEKFSLFLKQVALYLVSSHLPTPHYILPQIQGYSAIFGILLVALGTLICLLSFVKYKKIEMQINNDSYKPASLLDVMLTLTVFFIGIFLTIYLIYSV